MSTSCFLVTYVYLTGNVFFACKDKWENMSCEAFQMFRVFYENKVMFVYCRNLRNVAKIGIIDNRIPFTFIYNKDCLDERMLSIIDELGKLDFGHFCIVLIVDPYLTG